MWQKTKKTNMGFWTYNVECRMLMKWDESSNPMNLMEYFQCK